MLWGAGQSNPYIRLPSFVVDRRQLWIRLGRLWNNQHGMARLTSTRLILHAIMRSLVARATASHPGQDQQQMLLQKKRQFYAKSSQEKKHWSKALCRCSQRQWNIWIYSRDGWEEMEERRIWVERVGRSVWRLRLRLILWPTWLFEVENFANHACDQNVIRFSSGRPEVELAAWKRERYLSTALTFL